MNAPRGTLREKLIATFAIAWIFWILGSALRRIVPLAVQPWLDGSMSTGQKALYLAFAVFNAYAEGYRGFQLRYCPRVVGRAVHLGANPKPLHLVLALPFVMSLFHAQRRQRITSWVLIVGLTLLIAWVKTIPQPWRGIIDGGVVIGLGWGLVSVAWLFGRYLLGYSLPAAVDLPDDRQVAAAAPA